MKQNLKIQLNRIGRVCASKFCLDTEKIEDIIHQTGNSPYKFNTAVEKEQKKKKN